jgi:hypothetical protein
MQQTTYACLKVSSADYHCSYLLVRWEVANDGSKLMAMTVLPVAVLIATAATGALADQAIFACWVLVEVVG